MWCTFVVLVVISPPFDWASSRGGCWSLTFVPPPIASPCLCLSTSECQICCYESPLLQPQNSTSQERCTECFEFSCDAISKIDSTTFLTPRQTCAASCHSPSTRREHQATKNYSYHKRHGASRSGLVDQDLAAIFLLAGPPGGFPERGGKVGQIG